MSTGNGKYHESAEVPPQPDPSVAAEESVQDQAALPEEPDEPLNPDEATRAEIDAARQVLSTPRMRRRPYKGPRSIPIMLLVLGMVIAMGAYAISWSLRIHEQNQRGDLRRLEERDVMSTWQAEYKLRAYGPSSNIEPPGETWLPLTAAERSTMEALRAKFGTQFKPDEIQRKVIEEVIGMRHASQPTSQPATEPTS